jgi:tetratricopeptide (TPR) repeat protein
MRGRKIEAGLAAALLLLWADATVFPAAAQTINPAETLGVPSTGAVSPEAAVPQQPIPEQSIPQQSAPADATPRAQTLPTPGPAAPPAGAVPTAPTDSPAQASPPAQNAPKTGIEFAKAAEAAQGSGDFAGALKLYDQALAVHDLSAENEAVVYNNRALAHWVQGDADAAIADYDRALKLAPQYAEALQNRALAYEAKGRVKEAIADYSAAIAQATDDAFALENRGRAELYAGANKAAIHDLTQALALAPANAYAVLWLHIARVTAGEDDDFEFHQNTRNIDLAQWPGPILSLFLGTTTFDNIRVLVDAAPDRTSQAAWACEANFYGGVLLRIRKTDPVARRFLEEANTYCAPNSIERLATHAELARLGG